MQVLNKNSSFWHIFTVIIIILSSYLSLSDLRHESIWFDEGYTYAVSQLPLDKLIVPFDVHPPLFYITESFFVKNGGDEEWLRLPSALTGIAGVILVYFISNKFFGAGEEIEHNQQFPRNKTITMIDIKTINQSSAKIQDFLLRNGYKLKETIVLVGLTLYRYDLNNE